MNSLLIELPWPDKGLSPNARIHHMQRAALVKKARADAYVLAMQELRHKPGMHGVLGPIALELEFMPPDRRAYDADGLLSRAKSALDGIADALKVNDQQFNPITIRRLPPEMKGGGVWVTLSASLVSQPSGSVGMMAASKEIHQGP